MKADTHIHGGVVKSIETNGGDVIMHGGVVQKLTTGNGEVIQYGGIIHNRVEYQTRYVSKKEDLARIRELEQENRQLSEQLNDHTNHLLIKIEQLKNKNESTRKELEARIAELSENIEGLKEAYHNVLDELKKTRRELKDAKTERSRVIADEHIDIFATMMSLYPYTSDADIAFEFGVPKHRVADVAKFLGLVKTKEARKEAVEYLRHQDHTIIERRGGAHLRNGKPSGSKAINKVAKNGRVLKRYFSITDAANDTGYSADTIRRYCRRIKKEYTAEGYTFRFAANYNN